MSANGVPDGGAPAAPARCLSRRGAVILSLLIPAALVVLSLLARAWLASPVLSAAGLCPLYRITGLRCPLCGGTHALLALTEGDLSGALRFNPLAVAGAATCAVLYVRLAVSCFTRPYSPFRPTVSHWLIITLAAVALIFTIVRNTPMYTAYLY